MTAYITFKDLKEFFSSKLFLSPIVSVLPERKVACMHVVLGNDDVGIKWKGIFDAILHNIISQPCSH